MNNKTYRTKLSNLGVTDPNIERAIKGDKPHLKVLMSYMGDCLLTDGTFRSGILSGNNSNPEYNEVMAETMERWKAK